jgi:hypothetical protein
MAIIVLAFAYECEWALLARGHAKSKTSDRVAAVINNLLHLLLLCQCNDMNITILVCHETSLLNVSKEVI